MKSILSIVLFCALSTALLLLTSFGQASESLKKVLQVNASLSIGQQVEFENAPFILLEGEPSTLAEEGLGGYKVEIIAERNQNQSHTHTHTHTHTLYSKVYNYTKSGYQLLGMPSIKLKYRSRGRIDFVSETAGSVILQLEIVEQADMETDSRNFGQAIR
ncbi:MAG: hypothetical protein HRU08_01220 [Oleispira sp.]|nr:hypothetical protein [Oleispira sp.]